MYLAMEELSIEFLNRYAVHAGARTPIATSAWNKTKSFAEVENVGSLRKVMQ